MPGETGRQAVSLAKLKTALKDAQANAVRNGGKNPTDNNRLSRLDPQARANLERISDYLKRAGMTTDDLHRELTRGAASRDIDKRGFVSRMAELRIPGLRPADLGTLFDALDANDDGNLSAHELGTFISGARRERRERLQGLDPVVRREMDSQIDQLFQVFDEDGDGRISVDEIRRTLQAFGVEKTVQQCEDMINTATDGGGAANGLDRRAFHKMMLPYLEDQFCSQEESVEELREKFREADTDGSGFLNASEVWNALRKMDPGVVLEDVVALMSELDADGDAQLGIDEFVALMSCGDQL